MDGRDASISCHYVARHGGDSAGRVKVLDDLSVAGHSNIFVIGDSASVMHNGKPLPGLALVAIQEGRYVALVIADRVAGKLHKRAFHYRSKGTLATVGRSYGVVAMGKVGLPVFLHRLPGWSSTSFS